MYKVINRNGSVFGTEPCSCEFVCDTTDDVSTLPTSITEGTGGKTKYDNQVCGSGSIAVVVDNGTNPKRYILDNQDVWCPQSLDGTGSNQDLSEYAKKTEIPTELPANGGNADTVNGHSVNADVPADAKFTDTIPVVYGDNLLINPDFKINQRGITGTFSEVGKYFVDRWKLVSGTVTVNDDGSITLNGAIEQKFEKTLNVGILEVITSISDGGNDIGVFTEVDGKNVAGVQISGTNRTISWVKLEYGRYDNPATPFVLPEPATELLKCQRYYQVVDLGQPVFAMGNGASIIRFGLTLPTAMRANPTAKFVPITGNYTWSVQFINLNTGVNIRVTDVPTAIEVIVKTLNYLNIKLTVNSTEIVTNVGYLMHNSGGFKINLDAEIY